MRICRWLLLAVPAALAIMPLFASELVYVGTYTGEKTGSKGIYAFRFDANSGKLEPLGLAAEATSPSFVAIHPNRRFLYAVGEVNKGGAVSAYSIDPETGKLKLINQQSTRGGGPCFVTVHPGGKCALVANYGTGSVAALPVNDDGSLSEAVGFMQHSGSGPNPKRQQGPHAHSINVSPDQRFALVPDLGLDKVFIYRLDPVKASLTANDPPFGTVPPGGGPRHLAFHPNGKFAYVIDEMGSGVTVFSWDTARGALSPLQTISALPKDFQGESTCAEVRVHPSGKFVYASNRGHDSIAVFSVDPKKGTLAAVEHVSTQGKVPRNFNLDPSGKWLLAANQNTNNIVVFRIDPKSGKLSSTGQNLQVGAPVCIRFR